MPLLDILFSKKKKPMNEGSREDTGFDNAKYSIPSIPSVGNHASDRKNMRMERRELLYTIVRESMARVGMLSSTYRYKVLSLDSRGSQYMIMVDLPQELASEIGRLGEIETAIALNAKARHDILVKAVYWRNSEPLAFNSTQHSVKSKAETPRAVTEQDIGLSEPHFAPASPGKVASRYESNREEEVAKFKQALAAGIPSEPPTEAKNGKPWSRNQKAKTDFQDTQLIFADTQVQQQQGRNLNQPKSGKASQRDFQDTEVAESVEKISPLSSTQYGDLN
jgi:hypothetical protein